MLAWLHNNTYKWYRVRGFARERIFCMHGGHMRALDVNIIDKDGGAHVSNISVVYLEDYCYSDK